MMSAISLARLDWQKLRLSKPEFLRLTVAGTIWGLAFSAGLITLSYCNLGMVCLDNVVMTTAISIAAGIFTIGPVAVYGRR
jgi:hypothetical protein